MEIKTGDIFMKDKNKGFTLIELLIALAISSIVMAAVWQSFQSQQKNYVVQEQVSAMQQNLRAGTNLMVREARSAGYDLTQTANAGVVAANSASFRFTLDLNEDGDVLDVNEDITYSLAGTDLVRDTGGGNQPVAQNITNLEFFYTLEDGTQIINPSAAQLPDIRRVDISMLAVTGRADRDYINADNYTTASGNVWGPFNDNLRRRILITSLKCRNMGLE